MNTTRVCPKCSANLPGDAAFCHKCGTALPAAAAASLDLADDAAEARSRERLQRALGDDVEVRRLLGRGGFGDVYVALDRRLKREIAVKTIRSDIVASEEAIARFRREAEAVAKLRHPNIIPVFDVGEADGLAFLTMPLIEGRTLADVLRAEGRLSVAEACRILREAASALDVAHRAGIIHRDIKPENLMLEGQDRSVVVMDFGIAKSAEARGLTGTGMLVGTPEYMSPEQAAGDKTLDHQSDQYSLAVVGYRMLSGQLPFTESSLQTHIFRLMTEAPPPLASVATDVPEAISNAIDRALSTEPTQRFGTIREFAATMVPPAVTATAGVRRVFDTATRVRWMRERLQRVRAWHVGLVAAAYVAFAWLGIRNVPDTLAALAASKPDARFAAQQWLTAQGRTGFGEPAFRMRVGDSVVGVLEERFGHDSVDRRASVDLSIANWDLRFRSRGEAPWWITVSPHRTVRGFRTQGTHDHVSADSARHIAEIALASFFPDVDSLAFARDSVIRHGHGDDHRFTWRVPNGVVASGGRDTVASEVAVTVEGDSVAAVSQHVHVRSLPFLANSPLRGSGMTGGLVVLVLGVGSVAGALYLLSILARRHAEVQWRDSMRLVGAMALVSMTWLVGMYMDETFGDSGGVTVVALTFLFALVSACLLAVVALGELLGNEGRPESTRGYLDVTRGRLLVPELAPGVAAGYAIGGVVLVCEAAAVTIARHLRMESGGWEDMAVAYSGTFGAPGWVVLGAVTLITGVILSFGSIAITSLLARGRAVGPLFPALPAVILGVGVFSLSGPGDAASATIEFAVFGLAVWHLGIVAALVGTWIWAALSSVPALAAAGVTDYRWHALAAIMVALVPAALGYAAYRRHAKGSAWQQAEVALRSSETTVSV